MEEEQTDGYLRRVESTQTRGETKTVIRERLRERTRGKQRDNLCVSVCLHKGQCCLFKAGEQLIRSTGGVGTH